MPAIPTITLNDGRAMPQLGLGVFQLPPEDTQALVTDALAAGYTHVDTATAYRNEAGVGAAVRSTDAKIFVTSKIGPSDLGADTVAAKFDATMARLGLSWLDLWLIHWPAPAKDLYAGTWGAMAALRGDRLRSVGVSNFTIEHLKRIIGETGVVPAVNQIELHPSFQQRALRAFHAEHGIATESWSPLGQGAGLKNAAVVEIARKHGRTPAQVVIRWHLDSGLVVIPKSADGTRLRENIDVFGFVLDEDDMARMAGLDRADGRMGPDPDTMNS